jgi:hypothetical protein
MFEKPFLVIPELSPVVVEGAHEPTGRPFGRALLASRTVH